MPIIKTPKREPAPAKPETEPLVAFGAPLFGPDDSRRLIVVGRDADGQPIYAAVRDD